MEIHRAQHSTPGTIEGKVMFHRNGTAQWLSGMDSKKKQVNFDMAVREAREIRKEDRADKEQMAQEMKERMQASRKALQEKDKFRERTEAYLEKLFIAGGLWTSVEEMNAHLQGLGKMKTRNALVAQINTHIRIFKKTEKIVLSKSSLEDLKACVVRLMGTDTL